MPGRICCARRPSSRPLIPGMTTSVSKRSTFRLFLQEDGQGSLGAGSRNDAIVQVSQKLRNICTQVRIVFDDEYRLQFLAFRAKFVCITFDRSSLSMVPGEIHSDAGTLADFAVDLHVPARLFYETIDLA